MSGMLFGRYRALFRIAAGGMAEVFAARLDGESGFAKLVAVKRVLPALGGDDTFARMFLEEARVSAGLSSPHIVSTLDVGRGADGLPFLVQDLVVGVSLVEILVAATANGQHVPLAIALEVLAQAAIGLHDAHEARAIDGRPMHLVHRDVSPHNLLVGADGRVRLTDFGVARVAFDRLVATTHGTLKGKYAYLSPEQLAGEPLDRRSDVFALGVVAWETIAARRLFARDTPTETLAAIDDAPVVRLDALRPGVPRRAADAVASALERRLDRRLGSARELADALRGAARAGGLEAADTDVAAWVGEVAPPRLRDLRERLAELGAKPHLETLADIEIPTPDSIAETAPRDGAATEIVPPTRQGTEAPAMPRAGRALAEAPTVELRDRPADTELERGAPSWRVPAAIAAVGIALGVLAWIVWASG
jgi:serine/threonine-protein kinase